MLACDPGLLLYLTDHRCRFGCPCLRMEDGLHVERIKHLPCLRRIEHVPGLIDAEFFQNDRQLCLQHFLDAMINSVCQHKIDGADGVRLPDAVHTTDALFKPHGIPGDVVVDDDMAELQASIDSGPFDAVLQANRELTVKVRVSDAGPVPKGGAEDAERADAGRSSTIDDG